MYHLMIHLSRLRAFRDVSVGLIGSLIGVHWSLALSAMVMLAIACGLLALTWNAAIAPFACESAIRLLVTSFRGARR